MIKPGKSFAFVFVCLYSVLGSALESASYASGDVHFVSIAKEYLAVNFNADGSFQTNFCHILIRHPYLYSQRIRELDKYETALHFSKQFYDPLSLHFCFTCRK